MHCIYIHACVCVCARIFIRGQLHELRASNNQRPQTFTRMCSSKAGPIDSHPLNDAGGQHRRQRKEQVEDYSE